jgi:hypothetical protein
MLPEMFNVLFQIGFQASLLLGLFYMFIAGVSQVVTPNRRFTLKENSTVPDCFIGLNRECLTV